MKSLAVFYLLICAPLAAIIIFGLYQVPSDTEKAIFSVSLLVYALIYHPIISGLRLLSTGKIKRNQFIRNFIPGWNQKYFGYLFFNR